MCGECTLYGNISYYRLKSKTFFMSMKSPVQCVNDIQKLKFKFTDNKT